MKHKLPFNGDWLFVTETPYRGQQDEGPQQDYVKPNAILCSIESDDIDVIRLVYERAKGHESVVYETANHVRDKAKALLSSASFVSAALLGVASLLLTAVTRLAAWIVAVELLLFILITSHLLRSLYIAMEVMTREESVMSAPEELISPPSAGTFLVIRAYKQAISEVIAYANQTREHIRKRVNRLIIGQHAFRMGLLGFVLFVVLHVAAVTLADKVESGNATQKMMDFEARLLSLEAQGTQQATALTELTRDISRLRVETELIIERLKVPNSDGSRNGIDKNKRKPR